MTRWIHILKLNDDNVAFCDTKNKGFQFYNKDMHQPEKITSEAFKDQWSHLNDLVDLQWHAEFISSS